MFYSNFYPVLLKLQGQNKNHNWKVHIFIPLKFLLENYEDDEFPKKIYEQWLAVLRPKNLLKTIALHSVILAMNE